MLLSVAEKSGNYAEETGSEFFPEQPGPELPAEQRNRLKVGDGGKTVAVVVIEIAGFVGP